MKPILPPRVLIAIGLFLLAGSFILQHYIAVPDFVNGFLKGLAISIVLLSLLAILIRKRSNG